MSDEFSTKYSNQSGILDISLYDYLDIAIIGVGSIGSFLAFQLNKLGFTNLVLIDFDVVEEKNVPTQLYCNRDIGNHKVTALKDYLVGNITSYKGRVTETNTISADIACVCVDSLKQRNIIFKSIMNSRKERNIPKLLIDGRMHRLVFEVYTIPLADIRARAGYVLSLEQKEFGGNCTEKGIIQNVSALTACMIEQIRKVVDNKPYKEAIVCDFEQYKFLQSNMPELKTKRKK